VASITCSRRSLSICKGGAPTTAEGEKRSGYHSNHHAIASTIPAVIYAQNVWQSWPDKLGQLDKWSFCLTTAKMAVE